MSTSSGSTEREIDKYQDVSPGSGGIYESSSGGSSSSSSDSSSLDKHYSSGIPGFPLKEFQEMQRRMASGVEASSSRRSPSPPQNENEEENVIYSCAPKVAFTLDVSKFKTLVGRYKFLVNLVLVYLKRGNGVVLPFQVLVYIPLTS